MKESILSQLLIKCPFPEVFEDISNCAILTTQQHISHVNTITGIEVLCVKPSNSASYVPPDLVMAFRFKTLSQRNIRKTLMPSYAGVIVRV